jgi:transposase
MPSKNKRTDPKAAALLDNGTMNPSPNKVTDPRFHKSEFFDPRDLVQVKYEMLRRVLVESTSVTEASHEYGVSRPTYYQARASFEGGGIAGLVPRKPGPRGPHKLQGEVLRFVQSQHVPGRPVRARALAKLVREKFSIEVHARTIERALAVKKTPR